jgi:sugar/nucleoside kinase (ribokinase family)
MRVACLGDIMLDVIVCAARDLAVDDDTPAEITFAPGGQAANTAAWVVALGGEATVFGPHGPGSGQFAVSSLAERGVTVAGPVVDRSGAVVSVVTPGRRTLASDGGATTWLDEVRAGPWLEGADWLHLSGYALLRAKRPDGIVETVAAARDAGVRVALDPSSAAMITEYGVDRFRELWLSLRPDAVFANDEEWATCPGEFDGLLVLKQGAGGARFGSDHRPAPPAEVVDVTGAGDALAAGWFVGGPDLAMVTATRCISKIGAQP